MRFFQAQNCHRWPDLFESFDTIGGILYGFCGTDNPEQIGKIEVLIAQPKLGVSEITEEECLRMVQKKIRTTGASRFSNPRPVPSSVSLVDLVGGSEAPKAADIPAGVVPAGGVLKGSGSASVDTTGSTPEPDVAPAGKPVPSLAEALQVGEVEPPPSAKPRNSRKTK